MHVIGTAGHVDHGKSTLVEALTGINPDRLKEEREREMTIDLGFAWLTLPGEGLVGVIDVPGHRDFIENMLAGVGGIDAALFVVAADEGVMPQTREHLAILNLLQIPAGVVALTKVDLAPDADWLELIQADLRQVLATSFGGQVAALAQAPIVPVSARTGAGLDELRDALARCLAGVPARPDRGRPRLPVDRVFTVAGFGTVVTGTLSDGHFSLGDEVEILPRGQRARVRGLQTHGTKLERAEPGSRVAINLAGVSTDEVRRGEVVTHPGVLRATELIDVQVLLLPDAAQPLKHGAEVKFFCGAAEIVATARLLGADTLQPGETGWVQLKLAEPGAPAAGDRFIVRTASPAATIGGGRVIDAYPARRHRRFKREVIAHLETLARGTPGERLAQALERGGVLAAGAAVDAAGLDAGVAQAALGELVERGEVLVLGGRAGEADALLAARAYWEALAAQIDGHVRAYHASYPLRTGMPREELKSRLKLEARAFAAVLGYAVARGLLSVTADGASVRRPDFEVRFTPEQQRRIDTVTAVLQRDPVNTPLVREVSAGLGADVYAALLERGELVQVSGEVVFLGATYARLLEQVRAQVAQAGHITVAEARDLFQTSRKYALALLEYLDQQGITVRKGDERVLRAPRE
jgi:selenocysteine-specific elongation factor